MARLIYNLVAGLVVLSTCACASTDRNVALPDLKIDPGSGYRGHAVTGQKLRNTLFIVTFSGGGTRAAALSQGVLRELDAIEIGGGRKLLDEVDVISSVSGGSVAAANYVVNGREGFGKFESGFLGANFMPDLIDAFFNPINIVRYALTSESRIDRLVGVFKDTIVGNATYGDLKTTRPFLLLNAADMTTSERFTFTQSQFDLICSDLSKFSIAEAVAASAAFPVGLTPIALTNHSPKAAERNVKESGSPANQSAKDVPPVGPTPCELATHRAIDPEDAIDDTLHSGADSADGVRRSGSDTLFVSRTTDDAASAHVKRDRGLMQARMIRSALTKEEQDHIHLLDGGIADNLGVSAVLHELWEPGGIGFAELNTLTDVFILVVNARADQDTDRDKTSSPPGIIDMIETSIGTAIDNRSTGLVGELAQFREQMKGLLGSRAKGIETHVAIVDFDRIRPKECRYKFAHTPTNWGLNPNQVGSLMEMGSAMVRASPAISDLAVKAGGHLSRPNAGTYPGQQRASLACERMTSDKALVGPDGKPVPVRFGNTE